MTVASTTRSVTYTGNGVVAAFPTGFRFLADADLKVTKITIATGAKQSLTLGVDYMVTGAGNYAGGDVILLSGPLSSAYQIKVENSPAALQPLSLPTAGQFDAKAIETQFDRQSMGLQALDDRFDDQVVTTDAVQALITAALGGGSSAVGDSTLITATGSTTARTLAARFAQEKNVLDFAGGSSNLTTAFAAAITALGGNGGSLYIPAGNYTIASKITLHALTGITIRGDGPQATKLSWTGGNDDMFLVRNCYDVAFRNLRIVGNATPANRPNAIIRSQVDSALTFAPGGCTRNTFSNLYLGGDSANMAVYGIRYDAAATDQNNEFGFFERVSISNVTTYCVSIEHKQSKGHQFVACDFGGGQRGLSSIGSFKWYGGSIGQATDTAIYIADANDFYIIDGMSSEGCNRWLVTGGPSGASCPVVMRNCRLASNGLNADKFGILFKFGGIFTFEDNGFDYGGSIPLIKLNQATQKCVARIIGNSWGGTNAIAIAPGVDVTTLDLAGSDIIIAGNLYGNVAGDGSNTYPAIRYGGVRQLSTSWDPGTLGTGQGVEATFTVTGARAGDNYSAAFTTPLPSGVIMGVPQVTANDTVTLKLFNFALSAQTVASGTLNLRQVL